MTRAELKARREKVVALYKRGLGRLAIAERLGMTPDAVTHVLTKERACAPGHTRWHYEGVSRGGRVVR